jgi:hypothetical protein
MFLSRVSQNEQLLLYVLNRIGRLRFVAQMQCVYSEAETKSFRSIWMKFIRMNEDTKLIQERNRDVMVERVHSSYFEPNYGIVPAPSGLYKVKGGAIHVVPIVDTP